MLAADCNSDWHAYNVKMTPGRLLSTRCVMKYEATCPTMTTVVTAHLTGRFTPNGTVRHNVTPARGQRRCQRQWRCKTDSGRKVATPYQNGTSQCVFACHRALMYQKKCARLVDRLEEQSILMTLLLTMADWGWTERNGGPFQSPASPLFKPPERRGEFGAHARFARKRFPP